MGKSQKQRSMRRHNPVRVPDSHLPKGLAAASASSSKKDAILPIIQKMENVEAAERKWACVAVSNLIQNDPSTRRLLQGKNVVGALITRLSDNDEEVVVEATGALRNLCVDGGYDICGEMYNKNILAPLKTFIPKISGTLSQYLQDPKSAPENAKKLIYEFAENVITILWCLSETSNKALNAINDMTLVPFLMSFLASRDKLSISPVNAAAQCLYVLTDDNPPASREIKFNAASLSCLAGIVQEGISPKGKNAAPDERIITLRVLAAGILRNVSPLPSGSVAAAIDLESEILLPLLQPVISSTSLIDVTNAVQEIIAKEELEPSLEKLSIKGTPKSDHKTEAELTLERLETKLRTIQLALEILTGVCATLPDPEVPVDDAVDVADAEEDEDDDVPDDDAAMDADADDSMALDADAPSSGPALSPLLAPLLRLIQPTPLSFPPAGGASPHPPTTSALGAVHVCALECLNNLFLARATSGAPPPAGAGAGAEAWDAVWAALAGAGTEAAGPGQERRREVWEVGVGVLWGIGGVWKGVLEPKEDQVKTLMQLCDATKDDAVRVRCVGALECLAQHPTSLDANRIIAEYLLSLLPSPAAPAPVSTEVSVQALSALIDIYADERVPYDANFRAGAFVDRLAGAVDGVKKAVRAVDRRKDGGRELKLRAEETRDNLVAFIRYRRGLKL